MHRKLPARQKQSFLFLTLCTVMIMMLMVDQSFAFIHKIKLENYNGWNLPFANKVQIYGGHINTRTNITDSTLEQQIYQPLKREENSIKNYRSTELKRTSEQNQGDKIVEVSQYNFPRGIYTLLWDPSALFSIVFLDRQLPEQVPQSKLVDLNFTFYGEENVITQGFWSGLVFEIPIGNGTLKNVTLNTFVSYSKAPIPGVNGIIGLARSQYSTYTNFLAQFADLGFDVNQIAFLMKQ